MSLPLCQLTAEEKGDIAYLVADVMKQQSCRRREPREAIEKVTVLVESLLTKRHAQMEEMEAATQRMFSDYRRMISNRI